MDKGKFLGMAACFLFVLLTSTLAFAERECTHEIVRSDGTKEIITNCDSSRTVSSEDFWNKYLFYTLAQNFFQTVQMDLQSMRDQFAKIAAIEDQAKQTIAEMKQREEDQREAQFMREQQEALQLQNAKDQQEMQKQQQQDFMEEMSNRPQAQH